MENLVGKTLGKYRIVARLGKGGMAEVYKAYQPSLKRYVAIKVMHPHLSEDEEFLGRFEREALATGKLGHPNIVQVMDFDQEANTYYMVLQFVDGPTLKDEFKARRRQRKGFTMKEIVRIMLALGEAIDYAHARKMVHRDLKPANIMINEEGQVLLTDFGIARLLDGTQHTATGAMSGTPAYMSPEQGQGKKVDERSDIYALGIILYELVTGRVPYEGDTPIGIVMKHIREPIPLPSKVNPRVPAPIEQIIVKALSKEPEERYQTAGEMARVLQDAVGLPPGDTLRRYPLERMATGPQLDDELDPTTDRFTAVGTTAVATQTGTLPNVPLQPEGATVFAPPQTQPQAKQGMSPILLGVVGLILLALVGGGGYLAFAGGTATPVAEVNTSATAAVETTGTAAATSALAAAAEATTFWLGEDDDRDGLTNEEEVEQGTLPDQADTDEDGLNDFAEINDHQTDPLKSDSDSDGLLDGDELAEGTDPRNRDTDGDGVADSQDDDPQVSNATQTVEALFAAAQETLAATEVAQQAQTATAAAQAAAAQAATSTAEAEAAAAQNATQTAVAQATGTAQAKSGSGSAQTVSGTFNDFEFASSWQRGDEPNGTFERSSSEAYTGDYAGQLSYNFSSVENDYVVFRWTQGLSAQPKKITAWVKGDGSTHFLNIWVKDSQGETWQFSFGRISHTGWQQMTANLNPNAEWPVTHIDGPDNGALDYPITFQTIVLDDAPDNFVGNGTIYIDDLTSE